MARLPHQPGLDGLRGVAVAAVLFYHAGFPWMVGGYLGVSTFFTLSGFLIASLLVVEREATGRIDLAAFWERRFRRIMPAAFIALGGIALFGALVADDFQRARLRGDGFACLGWVLNWWFIATHRGYVVAFGSPSPVQHFWSLAIEEQFYLVFPLVAAAALARGSRRLLGAILVVACIASVGELLRLAPTDVPTSRLYYGTDTRAAELLAGAVLGIALAGRAPTAAGWRSHVTATLGLAGLGASVGFWMRMPQDAERLYAGGLALYTLATVAILAAAVLPGGPVRRVLSLPSLRWLGRISYGVYLYHFPIFLWLTAERTALADWPLLALRLALTLAVAEVSWRWVESPIRAQRRVLAWRRWALPPAAAGFVALAFILATLRGPAAAPLAFTGPPDIATLVARPGEPRIMVIGDSVAQGIGRALERWGHHGGHASIATFTQVGCGLARDARPSGRDADARAAACEAWTRSWSEALDRFRPQVVAVYTGGWDIRDRALPEWGGTRRIGDPDYDRWLRAEYEAVVDLLSSRGARVVWLTSACVRRSPLGLAPFDPERIARLNQTIIAPLAASRADRVSAIDLFKAVCPGGRFTTELDGIRDARPDGVHFSDAAAEVVARWLGPQLVRQARRVAAVP